MSSKSLFSWFGKPSTDNGLHLSLTSDNIGYKMLRAPKMIRTQTLILVETMKLLASLLLLIGSVSAGQNGLDFIQSVSVSTFTCLKNNDISFVIPRIFTSVGTVDSTGINNIKNAHSAGIATVDGYLFPCLATHCASAANQVKAALDALKAQGTTVSTLWLDIERLAWPADHTSNRAFVEAMVKEAQSYKQTVGIYSNYYNWQDIVGLDYTGQSSLPLWWATYNGQKDYSAYKAFGGWTTPSIHQYQGTTTGPCGVSVDLNYKV